VSITTDFYQQSSHPTESAAKKLKIRQTHVITVTGKPFMTFGHAPASHSNRRSKPEGRSSLSPTLADKGRNQRICSDFCSELGNFGLPVHSFLLMIRGGGGNRTRE
jgi:hypothetical protein